MFDMPFFLLMIENNNRPSGPYKVAFKAVDLHASS
jgi:hypothetical protein